MQAKIVLSGPLSFQHPEKLYFFCVPAYYTFASTSIANFTLTRRFHQIVDIDMEVIIKLDEIHRFGFNLVDDLAWPFGAIFFGIFHMFIY